MSEYALALDLSGADLSVVRDPIITDVIAGVLSSIDSALPDTSARAGDVLGIEAGADQVISTLVDGPGYELIQNHLGHTPTPRHVRDDIRSTCTVVPSTTTAAIMAFDTGARSDITNTAGFSAAYGGGIMNLPAMEGGLAPIRWQPTPTYPEHLIAVGVSPVIISPARFAGFELTGAALWEARYMFTKSFSGRVSAALRELRVGTSVVYLY